MGEYIFSIFVGGYFAAVGLFMNWYLKREMKRVAGNGQSAEENRKVGS